MFNGLSAEDVPLGFGMALAQNLVAMNAFATLSPEKQREILDYTYKINSKDEMHKYVQSIADINMMDG